MNILLQDKEKAKKKAIADKIHDVSAIAFFCF